MYGDSIHILKQFLVEFLNMLMMGNMVIHYRHLATADTCTYITHSVIVTYLLVLVVGIALAILSGIHHDLPPLVFVSSNESTTAGCRYHFITVE